MLGPVPVAPGGNLILFPDKPILSCQVDIFDWVGESMVHWTAAGPYQPSWNITGLSPGIYLARVKLNYQDGSNGTTFQKIVVSR